MIPSTSHTLLELADKCPPGSPFAFSVGSHGTREEEMTTFIRVRILKKLELDR